MFAFFPLRDYSSPPPLLHVAKGRGRGKLYFESERETRARRMRERERERQRERTDREEERKRSRKSRRHIYNVYVYLYRNEFSSFALVLKWSKWRNARKTDQRSCYADLKWLKNSDCLPMLERVRDSFAWVYGFVRTSYLDTERMRKGEGRWWEQRWTSKKER